MWFRHKVSKRDWEMSWVVTNLQSVKQNKTSLQSVVKRSAPSYAVQNSQGPEEGPEQVMVNRSPGWGESYTETTLSHQLPTPPQALLNSQAELRVIMKYNRINVCVSPKILRWNLIPKGMVFGGGRGFARSLAQEAGPSRMRFLPLQKRPWDFSQLSLLRVRTRPKSAAVPGKRFITRPNHAGTFFTFDFQPPNCEKQILLFISHPVYGPLRKTLSILITVLLNYL